MQDVFVRQLKNATDEEIERVVAVNVAAFADDEFNRILVGGDISILPLLMRAQIKAGLIGGEVYVAGFSHQDISSAAVWFGPGQEMLSSPEQGNAGFNEFMGAIGDDTRNWWTNKKANWHLQLLATEPRSQRKGLASALVKRVDQLAREEGKALTVETETEGALAFYKANGFTLKAEKAVPTDAIEDVERPIPIYVLWKNHGTRADSPMYTS
ncbi:hypothetical protein EV121DRAFT_278130 [Schizophyllum commune]